jgi:hypothetical protein
MSMSMRFCVALLAGMTLLTGSAMGGVLLNNPAAWYDPELGAAWTGSTTMDNGHVTATIEWAVFAPGDYPGLGYTPGADQFVYAYQVFSTGPAPVTQLTVNMIASNEAQNITHDAVLAAGGDPWDAWFGAAAPALQTSNWGFGGLTAGQHSDILVYSSVNMPVWDKLAYIVDEGTFAFGPVPTPSNVIPEPATIGLLLVGGSFVAARRRRR